METEYFMKFTPHPKGGVHAHCFYRIDLNHNQPKWMKKLAQSKVSYIFDDTIKYIRNKDPMLGLEEKLGDLDMLIQTWRTISDEDREFGSLPEGYEETERHFQPWKEFTSGGRTFWFQGYVDNDDNLPNGAGIQFTPKA